MNTKGEPHGITRILSNAHGKFTLGEGQVQNNEEHGWFRIIDSNGETFEGICKNGEYYQGFGKVL